MLSMPQVARWFSDEYHKSICIRCCLWQSWGCSWRCNGKASFRSLVCVFVCTYTCICYCSWLSCIVFGLTWQYFVVVKWSLTLMLLFLSQRSRQTNDMQELRIGLFRWGLHKRFWFCLAPWARIVQCGLDCLKWSMSQKPSLVWVLSMFYLLICL